MTTIENIVKQILNILTPDNLAFIEDNSEKKKYSLSEILFSDNIKSLI